MGDRTIRVVISTVDGNKDQTICSLHVCVPSVWAVEFVIVCCYPPPPPLSMLVRTRAPEWKQRSDDHPHHPSHKHNIDHGGRGAGGRDHALDHHRFGIAISHSCSFACRLIFSSINCLKRRKLQQPPASFIMRSKSAVMTANFLSVMSCDARRAKRETPSAKRQARRAKRESRSAKRRAPSAKRQAPSAKRQAQSAKREARSAKRTTA